MGSGNCLFHAPDTFDLDDDESKVVLLDTRDSDDAIRAAADACPTRAITIIERSAGEPPDAAR
jgi:ferredoxin